MDSPLDESYEMIGYDDVFINEFEKALDREYCKFLMYGRSNAGKTTLSNALIRTKSSGGTYGPSEGTGGVTVLVEKGSTKVYDTKGLVAGKERAVKAEIKKKCHPREMDCVIICLEWKGRLEEEHFEILHSLDPTVWTKAVFALTKCDELPLEINSKEGDEKKKAIKEMKSLWVEKIKGTLRKLRVTQLVVDNIQVVLTTDTSLQCKIVWDHYGESNDYDFIGKVMKSVQENISNLSDDQSSTLTGLVRTVITLTNESVLFSMIDEIRDYLKSEDGKKLLKQLWIGGAIAGGVVAGATLGVLIAFALPVVLCALVAALTVGGVAALGLVVAKSEMSKE